MSSDGNSQGPEAISQPDLIAQVNPNVIRIARSALSVGAVVLAAYVGHKFGLFPTVGPNP